jgi:hypothetical protein
MVGQPICETEPPAPKFAWIFVLERRIDPFTNIRENLNFICDKIMNAQVNEKFFKNTY